MRSQGQPAISRDLAGSLDGGQLRLVPGDTSRGGSISIRVGLHPQARQSSLPPLPHTLIKDLLCAWEVGEFNGSEYELWT